MNNDEDVMKNSRKNFLNISLRDESGATLVEYGVALLVVIIVGATSIGALATAVGDQISTTAGAF